MNCGRGNELMQYTSKNNFLDCLIKIVNHNRQQFLESLNQGNRTDLAILNGTPKPISADL